MDGGVLKLVFLLVVEHDAVLVDEVEHRNSPFRGAQELHEQIVLPFLRKSELTLSSFSFFLGFLGSSFFFPNSQSSMLLVYIITP